MKRTVTNISIKVSMRPDPCCQVSALGEYQLRQPTPLRNRNLSSARNNQSDEVLYLSYFPRLRTFVVD
jgi:hypothetical protein